MQRSRLTRIHRWIVVLWTFDLLALGRRDLRLLAYGERKPRLASLVDRAHISRSLYSEAITVATA